MMATSYQPAKELLKNAAKQRIRRMIAVKSKRTDLSVPPMVKEQWDKGTDEKNQMAQMLLDSNWDKDPRYKQFLSRFANPNSY